MGYDPQSQILRGRDLPPLVNGPIFGQVKLSVCCLVWKNQSTQHQFQDVGDASAMSVEIQWWGHEQGDDIRLGSIYSDVQHFDRMKEQIVPVIVDYPVRSDKESMMRYMRDAASLKVLLKIFHNDQSQEVIGETLLNLKQIQPGAAHQTRWLTFQSIQTPRFDLAQLFLIFQFEIFPDDKAVVEEPSPETHTNHTNDGPIQRPRSPSSVPTAHPVPTVSAPRQNNAELQQIMQEQMQIHNGKFHRKKIPPRRDFEEQSDDETHDHRQRSIQRMEDTEKPLHALTDKKLPPSAKQPQPPSVSAAEEESKAPHHKNTSEEGTAQSQVIDQLLQNALMLKNALQSFTEERNGSDNTINDMSNLQHHDQPDVVGVYYGLLGLDEISVSGSLTSVSEGELRQRMEDLEVETEGADKNANGTAVDGKNVQGNAHDRRDEDAKSGDDGNIDGVTNEDAVTDDDDDTESGEDDDDDDDDDDDTNINGQRDGYGDGDDDLWPQVENVYTKHAPVDGQFMLLLHVEQGLLFRDGNGTNSRGCVCRLDCRVPFHQGQFSSGEFLLMPSTSNAPELCSIRFQKTFLVPSVPIHRCYIVSMLQECSIAIELHHCTKDGERFLGITTAPLQSFSELFEYDDRTSTLAFGRRYEHTSISKEMTVHVYNPLDSVRVADLHLSLSFGTQLQIVNLLEKQASLLTAKRTITQSVSPTPLSPPLISHTEDEEIVQMIQDGKSISDSQQKIQHVEKSSSMNPAQVEEMKSDGHKQYETDDHDALLVQNSTDRATEIPNNVALAPMDHNPITIRVPSPMPSPKEKIPSPHPKPMLSHSSFITVKISRATGLQEAAIESSRHNPHIKLSCQIGVNPFVEFRLLPDDFDVEEAALVENQSPVLAKTFSPHFNFQQRVEFLLTEETHGHLRDGQAYFTIFHRVPRSRAQPPSSNGKRNAQLDANVYLGTAVISLKPLLDPQKNGISGWFTIYAGHIEAGHVYVKLQLDSKTRESLFNKLPSYVDLKGSTGRRLRGTVVTTRHNINDFEPLPFEVCRFSVIVEDAIIPKKTLIEHTSYYTARFSSDLVFCKYFITYKFLGKNKDSYWVDRDMDDTESSIDLEDGEDLNNEEHYVETRLYSQSSNVFQVSMQHQAEFKKIMTPAFVDKLRYTKLEMHLYVCVDKTRHNCDEDTLKRGAKLLGICHVDLSELLRKRESDTRNKKISFISGVFRLINPVSPAVSDGNLRIKIICETLSDKGSEMEKITKRTKKFFDDKDTMAQVDSKDMTPGEKSMSRGMDDEYRFVERLLEDHKHAQRELLLSAVAESHSSTSSSESDLDDDDHTSIQIHGKLRDSISSSSSGSEDDDNYYQYRTLRTSDKEINHTRSSDSSSSDDSDGENTVRAPNTKEHTTLTNDDALKSHDAVPKNALQIFIEEAVNLPNSGTVSYGFEPTLPSTYVNICTRIPLSNDEMEELQENQYTTHARTHVIKKNADPQWDYYFRMPLFGEEITEVIFGVWQTRFSKPIHGQETQDLMIGQCVVDLTGLGYGLECIDGWYTISQHTTSQIKVKIVPERPYRQLRSAKAENFNSGNESTLGSDPNLSFASLDEAFSHLTSESNENYEFSERYHFSQSSPGNTSSTNSLRERLNENLQELGEIISRRVEQR